MMAQVPTHTTGGSMTMPLGMPGLPTGGAMLAMPPLPTTHVGGAVAEDREEILTACVSCADTFTGLADLRAANKYTDINLVIPDGVTAVRAHRVVIAASSAVLAKVLDTGEAVREIQLGQFIPPMPTPPPVHPDDDIDGRAQRSQDPIATTNALALSMIDFMYMRKLAVRGAVAAVATSRAARDLGLAELIPLADQLVQRFIVADPTRVLRAAVQYRASELVDTCIRVMLSQRMLYDAKVRASLTCLPLPRFRALLSRNGPSASATGGADVGGELIGLSPVDRFSLICAYVDRATAAAPCLIHNRKSSRPGAYPPQASEAVLAHQYCTCDNARPVDSAQLFADTMDFSTLDLATLRQASSMPNVPSALVMQALFAKLEMPGGGAAAAMAPASVPMATGGMPAMMPMPAYGGYYQPQQPQQPIPNQGTGGSVTGNATGGNAAPVYGGYYQPQQAMPVQTHHTGGSMHAPSPRMNAAHAPLPPLPHQYYQQPQQ
ncbi:hypothetical protein H9P43_006159 [Blastocladiella emersonii ATCC 22665]|nr:hypothetical protein H9P43_006159 [Blastocladiella emersonii ATCC 22665]